MGKQSGTTSTGNNYFASNACVLSVGPCERLVFVEVAGKEEYFSSSGIDLSAASIPYSLELESGRIKFYRGTSNQVVDGGTPAESWPFPVPQGHPDYNELMANYYSQYYRPVPYNDPSKAILKLDTYASNFRYLVVVEFDDFFMGFERHNFPTVRFGFSRVPEQNIITGNAANLDTAMQVNPMALMAEAWTNKVYCLGRPESTIDSASWQAVADELYTQRQNYYISAKYTKPLTFDQLVKDMAGYTGVFFRDNDQGQIVAGRFPQAEAAPTGIPVITDDDLQEGSQVRIIPTITSERSSEFELAWTNPSLSFSEDKVKATSARNRPDPDIGETTEYKAPFIQRGSQAVFQANRRATLDSKTYFKVTGIVISENRADDLELGEPFVLHLEYEGRTFEKICFPTKMTGSSESRMQVAIECESSRGYYTTQEFEDYVDEVVDPDDPIPELPHWDIFQATAPMAEQPYSLFLLASRNDARTTGFNGFFRNTSSELQKVSQQRVFGIPLEVVSGPSLSGPKEENSGDLKVKRVDPLDTIGWDSFPKSLSDEQYEDNEVYLLAVNPNPQDYYPERSVFDAFFTHRRDYQKFELMSMKFIGNATGDLTDPTYEIHCRRNVGNTVSTTFQAGQRIWMVRKSDIVFFTHSMIKDMEIAETEAERTGHFIVQPFREDDKRDISEDSEKSLEMQRTKLDDISVDAPQTGNAYLYEDSRGFRPQVYFNVTNLDPLITRLIVEYGPRADTEAGTWAYRRYVDAGYRTGTTAQFLIRHDLVEGIEYRFRIRGHQTAGWQFRDRFSRDPVQSTATAGIYTDWVYANPIVPIGKTANPTDPASFTLTSTPNGMEIKIPTHPDKDFKHYNVYVNNAPSLPAEPTFTMNDSLRSLSNLAAGQTYYVWVEAQDFDGNVSNVLGSQTVVPKPGVPSGGAMQFNVPTTQVDNTDWQYSNYDPETKNVTPTMRIGGVLKAYNATPTNDTWRYDGSAFLVTGGDRNTSPSPVQALGFLNNGNFEGGKQTLDGIAIYRDDLGIDWLVDFSLVWLQVRTGDAPLEVVVEELNIALDPATSIAESEASYNPAAHSITPIVKWAGVNATYNATPSNGNWRYGNISYPHGDENLVLTDPAIGYTSVNQMPVQRIDLEIIYRDSEGVDHTRLASATFKQQHSIYGQDGLPAAELSLVVPSVTVSTNEDGSGGDYSAAKTIYTIFLGPVDDTDEWTINITQTDCTHTHNTTTNEVHITSASADYAYLEITASKAGTADLVKRFAVFKSKNEAAADAAEALSKANQAIADSAAAVAAATAAQDTADDAETAAFDAVNTAAADATAKADAAEAAAIAASNIAAEAYTDQEVSAEEARAITDATNKANAAQAAAEAAAATLADAAEAAAHASAVAAAAADATAKADAAEAAAEAAAVVTSNAYADGLVTAEEARAIADAIAKADAAEAAAIAAAAITSQAQADDAQADAIAAAALDATTKADTAQAQAIAAAALTSAQDASDAQDAAVAISAADAQAKADAAQAAAEAAADIAATAYTDGEIDAEEARAITDATNKANAAQVAAIAAASTDASTKADAAEAAAILAAATAAEAYADGVVSAEEVRAIADAQAKADAAQAAAIAAAATDATNKANAAESDAIAAAAIDATAKSDAAQAAAIAAAAIDATNKADAAEAAAETAAITASNAYADGIVDAEEARAIADTIAKANTARDDAIAAAATDATTKANAAQVAAENAATVAANAYTDGEVSAEEARAIADATTKAANAQAAAIAAAQTYADATFLTEAVWGVEVIPPLRFQDVGVPSVAGLYSTDTYMGYHNGNSSLSGWRAYIQSDGQVFFGDPAGHYIAWDNSQLTVSGVVDIGTGTDRVLIDGNGLMVGDTITIKELNSAGYPQIEVPHPTTTARSGMTPNVIYIDDDDGPSLVSGSLYPGYVQLSDNDNQKDSYLSYDRLWYRPTWASAGTCFIRFNDTSFIEYWNPSVPTQKFEIDRNTYSAEASMRLRWNDANALEVISGSNMRWDTSLTLTGSASVEANLQVDGNAQVDGRLYIGTTDCYFERSGVNVIYAPDQIYGNSLKTEEILYLGADAYLQRDAANRIYTPDSFYVGSFLYIGSTDCYLQRDIANRIYTPDSFYVGSTLYIGNSDTNLYRDAANSLKTDDSFTVSGALYALSNITVTGHVYSNGQYFFGDSKEIIDFGDTWIRLNQNGDFTSGIYTPFDLRVDGNLRVGGSGYFYDSGATIITSNDFQVGSVLYIGSTDTNLYRSAANILRTADNFMVDGYVQSDQLRCRTGQQLILSAGESSGQATGQTAENIYLNAEGGVEISSSSDNWTAGWATRHTIRLRNNYLEFGVAGSMDTNLYRDSANILRTDDTFRAANVWTDMYNLYSGNDHGIRFWDGSVNYSINMSSQGDGTYGGRLDGTSDYNMYFRMSGGTNRGFVFKSGTTAKAQIDGAGNIFAVGDITAYVSDIRLKDVECDIENAIDKVKQLRGFYFRTNKLAETLQIPDFGRQVGVSAQDIEKVLPEIIRPVAGNCQYKTLDYGKIAPLLIEAIKEQQEQIEMLQSKIEELES